MDVLDARPEPTGESSYRSPLLRREMPGLDALRGVAILSVVFYHGFYWALVQSPPAHSLAARISGLFVFGWLGVFLFFVLSGFLITGILLDSKSRPHYWRNFYVRRVLRIMPAFVLVLLIVKVFFHATWLYVAVCMAYMANLAPMMHIGGFQYGPLWSLAVEEQFYLVWPWLAKLLTRRHLAYVILASIVFSPVLRYLSATGLVPLGDPHSMTWLISDNLAMGAMLALLLRSRWGTVEKVRRIAWSLLIAGLILLASGIPMGILHRTNVFGSALQTVPFELMFAAVLLLSLFVGERKAVLTWTRPLRFFGYISYGLYLCHVLVFGFADGVLRSFGFYASWSTAECVLRFIGDGTLSVLVAYLSRRHFEEFFLSLKTRLAPSGSTATPLLRADC
jgi:peptidoglycan/LPS O-acetylase OafA/YrhL